MGQRTFIPPAASGCEWLRAVARARTTADDAAAAADGAADAMTGVARTTRRSAIVNAIVFRRDAQKIINRPGVVTDLRRGQHHQDHHRRAAGGGGGRGRLSVCNGRVRIGQKERPIKGPGGWCDPLFGGALHDRASRSRGHRGHVTRSRAQSAGTVVLRISRFIPDRAWWPWKWGTWLWDGRAAPRGTHDAQCANSATVLLQACFCCLTVPTCT